MGFNAADVIPELDWNFEKYGQGKGTVPEPSDKMIEEALRAMAEASAALYKKLGLERPAEMTEEKINEVLAAFPEDFEAIAFADLTVKMIKIFEAVREPAKRNAAQGDSVPGSASFLPLADEGAPPGSRWRRYYEAATSLGQTRLVYYLARRFLRLSPEEWDGLPWYERYVYLDGFTQEGLLNFGDNNVAMPNAPAPPPAVERSAKLGLPMRKVSVPGVDWLDGIPVPSPGAD